MMKINKFIVFCIENYKNRRKISAKDALSDFLNYALFDYLTEGYDVLHTQSKDYIIADIEDFINRRKTLWFFITEVRK